MKKNLTIAAAIFAAFLFSSVKVSAQDLVRTNPKYTSILADTLGVRMVKCSLAPGEELAMHTHPSQMIYCLEGGQLTVNYKSGKKEVFDLKTGDAMQTGAEPPHISRNTGNTTISFLDIEIKGKK